MKDIKVIAFDADDTLWDCQSWFDDVERRCCELLSPWATAREVSEGLFATEHQNLPLTGYGTKAFTLSLIENAVRISGGQLSGDIVRQLLEMGKELLQFPTTPLPEVQETLQQLAEVFGSDRQVSVCREISKVHEESVRGSLDEVMAHFKEKEPKGEIVIVVGGR